MCNPKYVGIFSSSEGTSEYPNLNIKYSGSRCEIRQILNPGSRHSEFAKGVYDVGCIYLSLSLEKGFFKQHCMKPSCHSSKIPRWCADANDDLMRRLRAKEKVGDKGLYYDGCGRTLRIPQTHLDTLRREFKKKK